MNPKTDAILASETILPDDLRPPAYYLKKARIWAACPWRFFVDAFVYQAKLAGEVDTTEVWAIYEILQNAERRKDVKIDTVLPHQKRRTGHRRDENN